MANFFFRKKLTFLRTSGLFAEFSELNSVNSMSSSAQAASTLKLWRLNATISTKQCQRSSAKEASHKKLSNEARSSLLIGRTITFDTFCCRIVLDDEFRESLHSIAGVVFAVCWMYSFGRIFSSFHSQSNF